MNTLFDYIISAAQLNIESKIISADALDKITDLINGKQDSLNSDQLNAVNSGITTDKVEQISTAYNNSTNALSIANETKNSLSDYVLKSDLSDVLSAAGINENTQLSDITLGNCISALFELKNKLMS